MLPGKSKLLLLGATLVSSVVLVAAASLTVLAGEGNANYLGILSSSAPSGYTPSPTAYSTGSTVSFQFNVTNHDAVVVALLVLFFGMLIGLAGSALGLRRFLRV